MEDASRRNTKISWKVKEILPKALSGTVSVFPLRPERPTARWWHRRQAGRWCPRSGSACRASGWHPHSGRCFRQAERPQAVHPWCRMRQNRDTAEAGKCLKAGKGAGGRAGHRAAGSTGGRSTEQLGTIAGAANPVQRALGLAAACLKQHLQRLQFGGERCAQSWAAAAFRDTFSSSSHWPGSPGSPFGPWGPGSPCGPCGPGSPLGPVGPAAPGSPCGPGSPFSPRNAPLSTAAFSRSSRACQAGVPGWGRVLSSVPEFRPRSSTRPRWSGCGCHRCPQR